MNQQMGGHVESALINGATLSWREAGAGDDVVVLIHGFPFSSAIWRPQLEAVPAGWRMIAPDMRGFGGSGPAPDGAMSMDAFADDIVALLQYMGVSEAVLCGHSMGGYITFAVLRRAPALARALVLCDTRVEPDTAEGREGRLRNAKHVGANGTAALVDAMLPRLLHRDTRRSLPHVEQEVRAVMDGAPAPAVVAALLGMAERPDSTPQLRSIRVPVQLIVGAEDQITTAGDARLLARAIPGAQLEVIQNAGHLPGIEQPAEFNRVLHAFLHGVGGPS